MKIVNFCRKERNSYEYSSSIQYREVSSLLIIGGQTRLHLRILQKNFNHIKIFPLKKIILMKFSVENSCDS